MLTAATLSPAAPSPPSRSSHAVLRHARRLTKLCLMSMGKLEVESGGPAGLVGPLGCRRAGSNVPGGRLLPVALPPCPAAPPSTQPASPSPPTAVTTDADVAAVVASVGEHPSLQTVLLPSLDGHRR